MRYVKAMLDGQEFLQRVEIADNFFTRFMGLMYRKELSAGSGMLIRPCSQIHTFGMKFAIDAIFLNKDNQVVRVLSNIKPHRILPYISKSKQVLELAAGNAAGIETGSRILFKD